MTHYAVTRKTDDVVVFLFDEKPRFHEGLLSRPVYHNTRENDVAVLPVVDSPIDFTGGAYAYKNGVWSIVDQSAIDRAPVDNKLTAIDKIKRRHDVRKLNPVSATTADGTHYYKGGRASQRAIEDSEKYSVEKGFATVYVTDADRAGHQLSFEDTKSVRLAIADQYMIHYQQEQSCIIAIQGATSKSEVESILNDYLAL